jgi:purine-nucleoside phosphorylase
MSAAYQRFSAAKSAVEQRLAGRRPAVGLVLGSGLGGVAGSFTDAVRIPYSEIPGFVAPSVAGHAGELVVGGFAGTTVACLSGRIHLYEGEPLERVVFGVRLLAVLGCRGVLLTNAAGGIRADLGPGSLVVISDHLNLTGHNPLIGELEPGATRFIDMTTAYDPRFRALALDAARSAKLSVAEGVYAGVLGPSYETPAEVRMLRALGADVVGMSTVLETIALRERNVRVGAVSVVTNLAAGLGQGELDHADVQARGMAARDSLVSLLTGWVTRVAEELGE